MKGVSEKGTKQINEKEEKDSVSVLSTISVSSHNEVICYHWNDDWHNCHCWIATKYDESTEN